MKRLIFIGVLVSFVVSIVYAYTPPDYDNVTLTLGTGYTPPSYNNITLILGESTTTTTFNITLLSESPVASNGSTLDIEFNSSGTTESQVEPCVVSGSCQNAGSSLSIFEFTNTGSVSLNWSVCINDSMPSSISIKCGGTNSYSLATNVPVCSAGKLTLQSNIAVDSTVKGYCWSDFTTALASDTTTRTITHSSVES